MNDIEEFIPPPWFGILSLKRWIGQRLFHETRQIAGDTYVIWENASGYKDHREIRGEVRLYIQRTPWGRIDRGEGFIFYGISKPQTKPYLSGEIVDIVIGPRWRGEGKGKILVQLTEERIRYYGVLKVSGASVPESIGFWKKMGYKVAENEHVHHVIEKVLK